MPDRKIMPCEKTVPCQSCGAPAGCRCESKGGKFTNLPHRGRWRDHDIKIKRDSHPEGETPS